MSEDKPGAGLQLWDESEAPTAKRELSTHPCPRCRSLGIELSCIDGDPARGGTWHWIDCKLCRGAKLVTASVAAGYRE